MAETLNRKDTMSGMWTIAGLLIVLSGCAMESSPLQDMADEGRGLSKGVTFRSPPEVKLHTAHDLLTHASKYDQLISRSTAPGYTAKARAVYQSIVTSFTEEEYGPSRRVLAPSTE